MVRRPDDAASAQRVRRIRRDEPVFRRSDHGTAAEIRRGQRGQNGAGRRGHHDAHVRGEDLVGRSPDSADLAGSRERRPVWIATCS
jgi:hypothetical protein